MQPVLDLAVFVHAELVFPVSRDSVFGCVVHFPCADLHLEGNGVLVEHGCVKALVHIRLGHRNIVLEAVRNRLEDIVNNAENIVAVGHVVNNDPDREHVKNLVDALTAHEGLAVDTVDALDPAADKDVFDCILRLGEKLSLDFLDELISALLVHKKGVFDFAVTNRVEVLQRTVLKLVFDRLDTEAVSYRREYLHVFEGFIPALLLGHTVHSAHIVQSVCELYDDDADIVRHRDKHFSDVLSLLLLARGIRNL